MSDRIGNPEDRFSHDAAQMRVHHIVFFKTGNYANVINFTFSLYSSLIK